MLKEFSVTLDISKHKNNPVYTFSTSDWQSLKFLVTVQNDGVSVDLTGITPRIAIKKTDKTTILQDGIVTDAINGKCEFLLTSQAYVIGGFYKAEVMLYEGTEQVATTSGFTYSVSIGVMNIELESKDDWPTLSKAIEAGENEPTRITAEATRIANENERIAAEATRQTNEGSRQIALANMETETGNAATQALYAKAQGDYAKTEADRLTGTDVSTLDNKIGPLSNLTTTNKTSVVNAINEHTTLLAEKANGKLYRDSTATNPNSINLIQGYSGNAIASDLGQGIINGGGGEGGHENVIGGTTANVNTNNSNAIMVTGTGANLARILGGYDNVVNGLSAQISADHSKIETNATHGSIIGGAVHSILANSDFSAINGGYGNTINGDYGNIGGGSTNTITGNQGTIGGGTGNTITKDNATISGGASNQANGTYSAVGGGTTNIATGNQSTIAGGQVNTVSNNYGTIIGGFTNIVNADFATVLGGAYNTASGTYSSVLGSYGVATYSGSFVHSLGKFSTNGDAQKGELILRKQTTNETEVYVSVDNTTTTLNIPNDGTWGFTCKIVARRIDVKGESAMFEIKGIAQRVGTGASALVGTPTVTEIGKSAAALWTVRAQCVGNGVYFKVTGEAGKTINWVAQLDIIQVVG